MSLFRSKRIEIKTVVSLLTFLMVSQCVVAMAGSDRIYPTNKVTLYRGEKKVGVYTKEAPLPDGSVISTDGRCAVKLDDLYLVAEDQSVFSINTSGRHRNLFVKEGIVYFKTSAMRRPFSVRVCSFPFLVMASSSTRVSNPSLMLLSVGEISAP